MAEALGIVTSIIQLVDTALKAREYMEDFRHAPHEQQKLISEIDDLGPLLAELQGRIAGNPSNGILHQMKSPLATFHTTMEQFTEKLRRKEGAVSKFLQRLKWTMWSKKEAQDYLTKFEQFKSLLDSWLLVDLWDMGQQHQRDNDAILQSVANVAQIVDTGMTGIGDAISEQERRMDSAERTRIIDWLSPINFFLRQADISQAREPGTGGWLFTDPPFQQWESGSGNSLWCYGMPGAGKTVLSSMVVAHLGTKYLNEKIGVACIYMNHKEVEDHTPTKLLSSLWRQLVLGKDVGPLPKKLYQQHQEKQTSPSLDEICEVLRSAITEFLKVYIVVDAIDEYPETQRHTLLEYLTQMGPTVNLMITSRPHITPDPALPNPATLEIRANEDDVGRYVDAQIRKSPRLSKHVQSRINLREEIHSAITCTVDGMFLLAKLHIESLSTKSTVKGVREALKTLPKTLNNSYDDAMTRIGEQNEESRGIAHTTLTWVANAKRPLAVLEIQTALAVEPGAKSLDEDNILDMEIILSVCAGLVIVDEQLSVVRLVHYTAQEYLDSIQPQQFPDAHTEITRTLLTCLAFDKIVNFKEDPFHNHLHPLFEYSQYCLAHAAGPPERALRDILLDSLPRITRSGRKWMRRWWSPPWNFHSWPSKPSSLWIAAATDLREIVQFLIERTPYSPDPDCPEIIVASTYGHLQMVQLLVEHGADVNAGSERCSNALHGASYNGHENIVHFLIDHGANVNAQGGDFSNALVAASLEGHKNIVQLLIEQGADMNAQGAQGGNLCSALQAASNNGHENIVQLLTEQGADVNAQGGRYGNALYVASLKGHKNIVKLLIEHGADMNAQEGYFDNALQAASFSGHHDIIQLLIEHVVHVNAQGGVYGNALQAACLLGHEKIVQLLIEQGADINAEGGEYGNALQAASVNGHENIVQLLIEQGANINVQGGRYGNALQAASNNGNQRIVQLLIEKGTNVNVQGGECGNALQAASNNGNKEIVQLLIEHGANVNVQEGFFGNALHAVSFNGHKDIIQLLLEHGAQVNAQGGEYGNALQAACLRGHEKIVQLLIEQGANINAEGGKYGNALQAASCDGHKNIVQLLIEQGANLNVQGGKYGNALQAASNNGDKEIVQLLIEHGADVNAQEGFFGNALHAVSCSGHKDIIQLLIEQGANVNAQGGEFGSALQAASFKGHENIVQLLTENGADVSLQGGKYGNALHAALQSKLCDSGVIWGDHRTHEKRVQCLDNIVCILRENGAREMEDTGSNSESTASEGSDKEQVVE